MFGESMYIIYMDIACANTVFYWLMEWLIDCLIGWWTDALLIDWVDAWINYLIYWSLDTIPPFLLPNPDFCYCSLIITSWSGTSQSVSDRASVDIFNMASHCGAPGLLSNGLSVGDTREGRVERKESSFLKQWPHNGFPFLERVLHF